MRDLIDDRVTLLVAHQLSTVVPAEAVILESSPTHRRLHDRQFAAASG
jgi:ABC-type transport system involved in Fe-S cluster assembly fused permease/ATPase subunit